MKREPKETLISVTSPFQRKPESIADHYSSNLDHGFRRDDEQNQGVPDAGIGAQGAANGELAPRFGAPRPESRIPNAESRLSGAHP